MIPRRGAAVGLGLLLLVLGGCGERPRYVVERSVADFQIAPDYRDLPQGLLAPALERTRTLLAGDGGDPGVQLSLGAYHLALGHRDSAEAYYAAAVDGFEAQARALPPRTVASYGTVRARADAYVALAVARAARSDYSGARTTLARVAGAWLDGSPQARSEKTRLARFAAGLTWELEGRPERAVREYDALLAGTDWPRGRYARACAEAAAGALDSALVDFERVARSHAVERRVAHYHVGRLREMRADTTGAVAAYEAFLDIQTFGMLPRLRAAGGGADSAAAATADTIAVAMERSADERTNGLYRDAQARIQRLRPR